MKSNSSSASLNQRHSARLTHDESSTQQSTRQPKTSDTCNPLSSKIPSSMSATSSTTIQKRHQSQHHGGRAYKPAELYRTDFITAMKLPNTEILEENSYWIIRDTWRLDWEKGVQVPVKPDSLNIANFKYKPDQYPTYSINQIESNESVSSQPTHKSDVIKIPKKYLCAANDSNYKASIHEAYITHGLVNDTTNTLICKYDCDDMDIHWLNRVNLEFEQMGQELLTRVNMERIIENYELQAYEYLKATIDKLLSYSIEYDEGIVCDVCHLPDSEETNEIVFCDGCNMCAHQACYGIEKIPQGTWLCAPCSFGGSSFKPECVLCPNMGGALKATKNYRNWAHVSCALWIPETGFGNPDKMEPIINLNQIAPARWQLVCSLCKEKRGCCLQCSEKRCHTAFHVTCAFKHNLDMQTILQSDDDIVFKAYCANHRRNRQTKYNYDEEFNEDDEQADEDTNQGEDDEQNEEDDSNDNDEIEEKEKCKKKLKKTLSSSSVDHDDDDDDDDHVSKAHHHHVEHKSHEYDDDFDQNKFLSNLSKMNESERKLQIYKRIQYLNSKFYTPVSLENTEQLLGIKNRLHLEFVFNYWKMKRRFNKSSITLSNHKLLPMPNKALMILGTEQDLLNQSERMLVSRIRMFVNLRQDLERVRNLCYMIVKREKLKRQLFDIKNSLFEKQCDYLLKYSNTLPLGRSGRLKEILQVKNEQCVYDYPELWNSADATAINENSSTKDSKEDSCGSNTSILTKRFNHENNKINASNSNNNNNNNNNNSNNSSANNSINIQNNNSSTSVNELKTKRLKVNEDNIESPNNQIRLRSSSKN
jgi:hypothetical protein